MNLRSKKMKVIGGIVVALIILIGLDMFASSKGGDVIPGVDLNDIIKQGGTIEIDEGPSQIAKPDLNKKIIVKADMSVEAKIIVEKNIKDLQETLKKNPEDFNSWNTLGVYYKAAEDYPAAIEVWNYVGKAFPTNHVSFSNLAFLYGYYLKDAAKAEQNYLQAIQNAPIREDVYIQSIEYYRDVAKDSAKAIAVAEEGYKKLPASANLKLLLGSLKK